MDSSNQHPTLYEFLLEAELSHYFNSFRSELKINSVAQIKYVEEEDLLHLGMSKPEQRRLKKFFHKYYPQTYLKKIKKMILSKNKDDADRVSVLENDSLERPNIKVPSKHIISMDNISLNKELGVGEFGVVQQGIWTNEDGERIQVAIKCLCKERMQNNNMEFLKEAAIMHTIDHEHIVRLYGVALDTKSLMLVTELAPLRSLLECLKEPALRPSFGVLSLCEFAQQICDGMQYLENKRLIHRDLAARNILVFSKNKVKISDFGLSRALGVGKDYYQTNFNVNLKLPIACYIQILEAIDEPNFQRLEQPDCCPKEYYSLMRKCWQHDPSKRPKFSEIAPILPEYKPEQVQAIKDSCDVLNGSKAKKDSLQYKVGEIITVLDKKPISENSSSNFWKGVTNNGKTGLFNPANTVTYLGRNLPTNHATFSRAESKSGLYSSRRRLCRDMISRPQGDFKHTGHVGLDGAFFGDISFLGEKYHQLPKQVVTPYKPQDDKEKSNLSLNKIPSIEKFPLFNRSASMKIVSSNTWSAPSHDSDIYKDKTGFFLLNFCYAGCFILPSACHNSFRPISENSSSNFWKGVTNNGKTGLFNPANTVTYLGRNLPTNHATFSRAESKSGLYSSRRRLCRDMISRPQGDFKHTGHVGLDGAFFGDISFLGEKYHQLPKQVVTPYKPQDDKEKSNLSLNKIPSIEKFPLFNRSASMKIVSSNTWSAPSHDSDIYKDKTGMELNSEVDQKTENEDNEFNLEFTSFDLGPSLMEEVFKALGKSSVTEKTLVKDDDDDDLNVTDKLNELLENDVIKEIPDEQELEEPSLILSNEEITPKEEIAENININSDEIENDKSTNSLPEEYQQIDQQSLCETESENLENSEDKKENSFEEIQETSVPLDPQTNFKVESNNSSDLPSERTNGSVSISLPIATSSTYNEGKISTDSQKEKPPVLSDSVDEIESNDTNPLRMLRSGMPVRPKVRGNKHSLQGNNRIPNHHNSCTNSHSVPVYQVGGRTTLGEPPPPPSLSQSQAKEKHPIKDKVFFHSQESVPSGEMSPDSNKTSFLSFNPLPLPPRDRSKPFPLLKHHQRKHPLILPGQTNLSIPSSPLVKQTSCPDVMSCSAGGYGEILQNRAASDDGMAIKLSDFNTSNLSKSDQSCPRFTTFGHGTSNKSRLKVPPPKPSRVYNKDDTHETQIESEIDNLDNIPEEENCSSLSKNNFNSQDILTKQKNISQRIQHSDKNLDAKEVHIIQRILKDEQVTSEECVVALNETNWDVQKAIKYLRLQCILSSYLITVENSKQILIRCNWDVQQAANYLLATHSTSEDTTEV
ncbi:tyrosine-protein kinase PR2-like [Centruroides sculpturatus]|uniref:tyrosine-protein kinase PR2-like n=1 Tax=Centruroides sculpturatus TaxID=218467 RepID=UPI000C6D7E30|nr:tyrosine-protein kinase PR2-like [Centruroides sculpturatus]